MLLFPNINFEKTFMFYGWWIVVALTIIAAVAGGTVERGFTAIFEPISDTFSWSYTQVSLAASIRGITLPLFIPLTGFLFDHWGPRRWIFIGVIISGLSLLLFSRITSLTGLYITSFMMAVGLSTYIGMLPTVVVGNWFQKKSGLATSIVLCGGTLGGIMVPLISQLIDNFGWRDAMLFAGYGIIIICLPLSLLVRHKPEQYGYLPDGGTIVEFVKQNKNNSLTIKTQDGMTVKQAIKSRGFWHFAIMMVCSMIATTSVAVHVMPYLSSVGIMRTTASFVAMAIPLVGLPAMFSSGWLADNFNKRLIATVACISGSLSILLFVYVNATIEWIIVLFLITYGIGSGGFVPVFVSLQREYFGKARLGSIMGLISGLGVFGGMFGPPIVGWFFDKFGNYHYAWLTIAGISFIGVIIVATVPKSRAYSYTPNRS